MVRFALGTGRRLFFSQSRLGGGVVPAPSSHSFRFVCQSERWRGGKAKASVPGGGGLVVQQSGSSGCGEGWTCTVLESVRACACVFICVCMTLWWLVDGWWAAPWPCMGSWAHGCLLRTKAVVALVIHLCRLSGSYFILYFKLHSSNNDFYSFTSPILSYLLEIVLELI